jgi:CheY-like chemotaxis protein
MTQATNSSPERVLIVDDDPTIVMLLQKYLRQLSYDTTGAANTAEALERLAAHRFDLVITDLAMPQATGLDLIRRMRETGIEAEVVVLTAVGSVGRAVESMKAGAFDFLEKPVRFDRLRQVVEAAMAHRRARAAAPASPAEVAAPPAAAPATANATLGPPPVAAADHGAPAATEALPAAFGRYEVEALLGRGGMGEVYRCRDSLLGRRVAVKVLQAGVGQPDQTWELLARFQREAAAAGALNHPGIVAVHDLGRDDRRGIWFIVQELVDGTGLDQVLEQRGGRLPAPEAVAIGFQVADALAHAHAHGIVHRDVKPSNVLLRKDGSAKLLDFGLAAVPGSALTQGPRLFGSPTYIAPERIRGHSGTHLADQFSLGVVLYEVLAGRNPFDAENPHAQLLRTLEHEPPPVDRLVRGVPAGLAALLAQMMAKAAVDRCDSMEQVLVELARAGGELGLRLRRHGGPDPE